MFIFWFATIVFFATYILIATEKIHKTTAALVGAALMLLIILPGPSHGHKPAATEIKLHPDAGANNETRMLEAMEKARKFEQLDSFAKHVNFDVIFTLAGMMLLVNILSNTGLFQYVAVKCAKFSRGSPVRTMILLVVATAVLSAFLDNVTTILLIAPVTLLVAAELDLPPIPFLMAETIASNIGGTATLIGDPPNLIIGSVAKLDFLAFIVNLAPFISVLMVLYCLFLWLFYRKRMVVTVDRRARIMELDENAAITDHANMKRGGLVVSLTILGFLIHGALHIQPCVIAMAGAAAGLLFCKVDVDNALEKIEWSTIFFFIGLFIIVQGAEKAGLMNVFGKALSHASNWHPLLVILTFMWISGIAAALMNNVSFTAAMVAVISGFLQISDTFRDSVELSQLMWWGLALAVCLGGNGTLVGAAANLVTTGISEKAGQPISFRTFFIYGAPITFVSLIAASLYVTLRFYML